MKYARIFTAICPADLMDAANHWSACALNQNNEQFNAAEFLNFRPSLTDGDEEFCIVSSTCTDEFWNMLQTNPELPRPACDTENLIDMDKVQQARGAMKAVESMPQLGEGETAMPPYDTILITTGGVGLAGYFGLEPKAEEE